MVALKLRCLWAFGGVAAAALFEYGGYPPVPNDKTTPVQQRLAIHAPNAMSVAWNTYEQLKQACVEYGTSKDSLTSKTCSDTSVTYPSSRTWFNFVVLNDLKPAVTYYYKIVSTNSSVDEFCSPRPAGDKTPFNLNAVIDLGVYGENGFTTKKRDDIPTVQPALNHSTIGRLAQTIDDYELVIHPGDLAYADDWFEKSQNVAHGKDAYAAILELFYIQLQPISGRKPYMASPGNHEADCTEIPHTSGLCPAGQKNFTDFMTRFGRSMPIAFPSLSKSSAAQASRNTAAQLAQPPFWFSFEYGMVHITMIDTETDFASAPDGPGGSGGLDGGPFGTANQQLEFLEADLKSVDRSITPWVIVAGHRPWYTTGDGQCTVCQKAFEPLMYKYGVDLAVFGHVHNSQRFAPIYNGTVDPAGMNNPRAPMYIVAGGAGNIEGLTPVGKNNTGNQFVYAEDFSYATIKVLSEQRLGVDFIQSRTGQVVDSSVLQKDHGQFFVVQ